MPVAHYRLQFSGLNDGDGLDVDQLLVGLAADGHHGCIGLALVSYQDTHADDVALRDVFGSEVNGFDRKVGQGHDLEVNLSFRAGGLIAHREQHRVKTNRGRRDLDHTARHVHGRPGTIGRCGEKTG